MPNQALCIISSPYMNSNWSYSPETAKLGLDLCDFDLSPWPWPFVWTSLQSMVITPENFMMIQWWEHSEKGVTDRQTDGHLSMNKPTTWCKSGRVSLVSSSCLYKTQPERVLAQVCHTGIDADRLHHSQSFFVAAKNQCGELLLLYLLVMPRVETRGVT